MKAHCFAVFFACLVDICLHWPPCRAMGDEKEGLDVLLAAGAKVSYTESGGSKFASEVRMRGPAADDLVLAYLSELKFLRAVELDQVKIQGNGLVGLGELKELGELTFRESFLGIEVAKVIQKSGLKSVSFTRCDLSDDFVSELLATPGLEEIGISANPRVTDVAFAKAKPLRAFGKNEVM